jgi:hypothetical protein
MTPEQQKVWENDQLQLINRLDGPDAIFSVQKYEVRVYLNDDQDLVMFPASDPNRSIGDDEGLQVGLTVETWRRDERGNHSGEPETVKLMGLYSDWSGCLFHIRGIFAAHEVVL